MRTFIFENALWHKVHQHNGTMTNWNKNTRSQIILYTDERVLNPSVHARYELKGRHVCCIHMLFLQVTGDKTGDL